MNKYYGRGISLEMQKASDKVQVKYMLNNLQIAGLLKAFDFTERVSMLDHDDLSEVRLVTYKQENFRNIENTVERLPSGTVILLNKYKSTHDSTAMRKATAHFCPLNRHTSFEKFCDALITNHGEHDKSLILSEYLKSGVLKIKAVPVIREWQHEQD